MPKRDELLDEAERAADRLHGDHHGVTLRETLARLEALRDHVDVLIDATKLSIKQDEEG